MVDINEEAEKSLLKTGCKVYYQYPDSFNTLPCISFYNLTERPDFSSDNEEAIQSGWVQADIWTRLPQDMGDIAKKVNKALTCDGWSREMSADLPRDESGIFHKTMRFVKIFNV